MSASPEATVVIATTDERRRADAWGLVLASQSIPFAIGREHGELRVRVASEHEDAALDALRAFERENRPKPPAPPWRDWGPSWTGVCWALAIAALHALALGVPAEWDLAGAGVAHARSMLAGEWWRALTALTLHADLAHAASNTLAAVVIGTFAGRALGPGWATLLAVLAGAGANLSDAVLARGAFRSLGASSAIFSALGSLAGVQLVRRSGRSARLWRWAPAAGAAGVVAMLGAGEATHVIGHALGVVWGLGLGAGLARLHPGGAPGHQLAAGVAALALLAVAWAFALRAPGSP